VIALSLPVAILSVIGILQVGIVIGMWLKSVLGGGYDWGSEEDGES
jgi:hypothetical protein